MTHEEVHYSRNDTADQGTARVCLERACVCLEPSRMLMGDQAAVHDMPSQGATNLTPALSRATATGCKQQVQAVGL
jgi:Mg-chelatase subunit ChlD